MRHPVLPPLRLFDAQSLEVALDSVEEAIAQNSDQAYVPTAREGESGMADEETTVDEQAEAELAHTLSRFKQRTTELRQRLRPPGAVAHSRQNVSPVAAAQRAPDTHWVDTPVAQTPEWEIDANPYVLDPDTHWQPEDNEFNLGGGNVARSTSAVSVPEVPRAYHEGDRSKRVVPSEPHWPETRHTLKSAAAAAVAASKCREPGLPKPRSDSPRSDTFAAAWLPRGQPTHPATGSPSPMPMHDWEAAVSTLSANIGGLKAKWAASVSSMASPGAASIGVGTPSYGLDSPTGAHPGTTCLVPTDRCGLGGGIVLAKRWMWGCWTPRTVCREPRSCACAWEREKR